MLPWDAPGGRAKQHDVAAGAQEARAARERVRLLAAAAPRVQSRIRGRAARRRLAREQAAQLEAKLCDVAKLRAALAKVNRSFVAPNAVLHAMVRASYFAQSPALAKQVAALVVQSAGAYQKDTGPGWAFRTRRLVEQTRPDNAVLVETLLMSGERHELTRPLIERLASDAKRGDAAAAATAAALCVRACVKHALPVVFADQLMAAPGAVTWHAMHAAAPVGVDFLRGVCAHLASRASGKEADDQGEQQLANFVALLAACGDAMLAADEAASALLALVRAAPANVLSGTEGVLWVQGRVRHVDARALQQLALLDDVAPRLLASAFQHDAAVLDAHREADRAAWRTTDDELVDMVEPELAMPRRRLASIATSVLSSWAAKLGWRPSSAVGTLLLPDTSAAARALASPPPSSSSSSPRPLFVRSAQVRRDTADALALVFERWPASSRNPRSLSLLNAVVFGAPAVTLLFAHFEQTRHALPLAALCFSHLLLVVDEAELYDDDARSAPLPRAALERFVQRCNAFLDAPAANGEAARFRVARALAQLYDMHSRRPLIRPEAWLVAGKSMPADPAWWAVPFSVRARFTVDAIARARAAVQAEGEPPAYRLQVRRKTVLEDAVRFFARADVDLRKRVYVEFVNDLGAREAGIDARGLFKEFLNLAAETAFDPKRGLFAVASDGDGALFPSPSAQALHADAEALMTFAGKLLGKAVFEGVTLQPQLSFFLLAKLLRKLPCLADLRTLDRELFRNMIFLKQFDGDFADLGLSFVASVGGDGLRPLREVELVPGGARIAVTRANRFRFVNALAHFKLNVEGKLLCDALVRGFYSVVQPEWVAHFSERELQVLLSGKAGGVDVADLRRNTRYAGGYSDTALSPVVQWFWDVCERDMGDKDREALLRFTTSCDRPPVLGFAELNPRFTIQRVAADVNRLPTSSTCFNTLKLVRFCRCGADPPPVCSPRIARARSSRKSCSSPFEAGPGLSSRELLFLYYAFFCKPAPCVVLGGRPCRCRARLCLSSRIPFFYLLKG